jgi:hypothetical protein
MNFYNPYMNYIPYPQTTSPKCLIRGFLGRLRKGTSWTTILDNTQRTLGIVNQAIPLVKQTGPIIKNARTMFRVMNEFKKDDNSITTPDTSINKNNNNIMNHSIKTNNTPTFFQ